MEYSLKYLVNTSLIALLCHEHHTYVLAVVGMSFFSLFLGKIYDKGNGIARTIYLIGIFKYNILGNNTVNIMQHLLRVLTIYFGFNIFSITAPILLLCKGDAILMSNGVHIGRNSIQLCPIGCLSFLSVMWIKTCM